MTNGVRQTQRDCCMLIILYNFAHRLFIWFLSEPRAATRKASVEWTLDQAWCYSIAVTLDNKKWEIYSDLNRASIWKQSCSPDDESPLGMWCGASRHCCPSYSLPAFAEQPVALPPHVRSQRQRSLSGCWVVITAAEQGNSCRQGHLNHKSKNHHKAFLTFFTPGPLLF